MHEFNQPINRENDLKAIMEGYESRIGRVDWLADAFQKDGIQNSWDARKNKKKGTGWYCRLFLHEKKDGISLIGIEDKNTLGLTGTIPSSEVQTVEILNKEDPEERLATFLSSNWSKKEKSSLGSRGRGKMVFVGASEDNIIYFDSLRSSDNVYIFGKTYLTSSKSIRVSVVQGKEAINARQEVFGNKIPNITGIGTRIFIDNPRKSLVDSFKDGTLESLIQSTWWEILEKYEAEIIIDLNGDQKKVEKSPWNPVVKIGAKDFKVYPIIKLPIRGNYKIKNISLCYLENLDIPDLYKGISIQRSGMVIERLDTRKLFDGEVSDKIVGTVELEKDLEEEILKAEGPEHYNVVWTRSIPISLKKVITKHIKSFAKEFKLLDENIKSSNKEQKEAELTVQRELNNLAKKMGLTLGKGISNTPRGTTVRDQNKPLRLSISEFKTPTDNFRVDFLQKIEGSYATPINENHLEIKVLIRVWIVHDDSTIITQEEEMLLPENDGVPVGWDSIKIDDRFVRGKYSFRAKMVSMEDYPEMGYEKGSEVYSVSKAFYVDEDPEEKGILKF